ncbi:hypothetical protein HanRHA438_Chr03g0104121 [Helianthus annuus]|nr:hypothetical protein HanRHA438_Chr03g0104121 [Helianthus annuus]
MLRSFCSRRCCVSAAVRCVSVTARCVSEVERCSVTAAVPVASACSRVRCVWPLRF